MSALAWSLFVTLAAQADGELALRYQVSTREVHVGDVFQLDVVLQAGGRGQVEELTLPEFAPAFSVVRESRAEVRVNGRRELRFSYALRAEAAGQHQIGEARARRGASSARAAPITMLVVGDAASASDDDAPKAAGADPGARFGATVPAAFLEVTVDHASVFVGQQVVVTTTVYSQQPLSQVPRLPAMKPPGFLCVAFKNADEGVTPTQRTIKGRSYYAYVLHKDALFPLEAGTKNLGALTADVVPAGSLFARTRAQTVRSAAVAIEVKELPSEGRPARFAPGNVGQWRIEASARPTAVAVGQAFTLVVTVSGSGNLDALQVPGWDGGGTARVFPPSTRVLRNDDDAVSGRVLVETLVQPTEPGELRIPALVLASFDPERGEYVESRTAPLTIKVRGAAGATGDVSTPDARAIERAPRPLKTRPRVQGDTSELPVVAGAAVALVGVAGFALLRARARRAGSTAGERSKRREQRARLLQQASARADLAAVERALKDAVAERAGDDVRGLSSSALHDHLVARGVPSALAERVVSFIRDAEAARYAPGAGTAAQRLANDAVALVRELESAP